VVGGLHFKLFFGGLQPKNTAALQPGSKKIRLGGLPRRFGGSTLGAIAVSCVRHALAAVVFSRHLRLMCCVAVAFHFRDLHVRESTLVRGEW